MIYQPRLDPQQVMLAQQEMIAQPRLDPQQVMIAQPRLDPQQVMIEEMNGQPGLDAQIFLVDTRLPLHHSHYHKLA
jgi:hypothetical protein